MFVLVLVGAFDPYRPIGLGVRQKLPPEKQDAIAAVILEELEDEQQWDETFLPHHKINSPNSLKKSALTLRQVMFKKMGFDEL